MAAPGAAAGKQREIEKEKQPKLKGWILYATDPALKVPEDYECDALVVEGERCGIDMHVVNPNTVEVIITMQDERSLLVQGEPAQLPDFVLTRMGSGTTYFAAALIRQLERVGVPCFNGSEGIEMSKDKLYTAQVIAESNLPSPATMLLKFPIDSNIVEQKIGFPVVAKTLSGTQGSGVILCESKEMFEDLVELMQATNSDSSIILQQFIGSSRGRDLRVLVVGGRCLGVMERRSAAQENFKANVSAGGSAHVFESNPQIEWLALECARVLHLDIAGVDLLFDGDGYMVCEVNSSPGFKGFQTATGLDVPKAIFEWLSFRVKM